MDLKDLAVGDPSELFGKKELVRKVLGGDKADEFYKNVDRIDAIVDELEKKDIHWLSYLDDEYPDALREIEDRPHVLTPHYEIRRKGRRRVCKGICPCGAYGSVGLCKRHRLYSA